MDYEEIRDTLNMMLREHYDDTIKALISIEKNIDDKSILNRVYDSYMDNDYIGLLNDSFDELIDEALNDDEQLEM